MKNIQFSISKSSAILAGSVFALIFSFAVFTSPASAGILDGNFDCFPLPVCPPGSGSNHGGGHNNHNNTTIVDIGNRRTTYATPAPAPQPAPAPITNTNTNTNTNTIYVNGSSGGSYQVPVYTYPSYPSYPSYPTYPTYNYPTYPTYPTYPVYYPPVTASCSADTQYSSVGNLLHWRVQASGGNGYYTYSWSGTDGLNGSAQSLPFVYYTPGTKVAFVTVYSDGRSTQVRCVPVNVNGPVGYPYPPTAPQYPPQYPIPQNPIVDVACYATPTKAKIGQSVVWTVQVAGGVVAPYRVSWTGTDGLVGYQNVITKVYATPGTKKATFTVTGADGRTLTRACSTAVTVSAPVKVAVARSHPQVIYVNQPPQYPSNEIPADALTAAPVFSLSAVPWGWVAFLVILVLFVTVLYLIFNRNKI